MATVNVSFSFTSQPFPSDTLAGSTRVQLHLDGVLRDQTYINHPGNSATFSGVADGIGYVASVQRMNRAANTTIGPAATSVPFNVQAGIMVDIPGGVSVSVT